MGKELNSIKSLNINVFSSLYPHFVPVVLSEQPLVFLLVFPFVFLNLRWQLNIDGYSGDPVFVGEEGRQQKLQDLEHGKDGDEHLDGWDQVEGDVLKLHV